jgi:hypothetical protein
MDCHALVSGEIGQIFLAVGFQLDGIQDANHLLNYVTDMHQLYNDAYLIQDNNPHLVGYKPKGLHDWCNAINNASLPSGIPYGLKGDLGLEEALESGLHSLQAIRYYPATYRPAVESRASKPRPQLSHSRPTLLHFPQK